MRRAGRLWTGGAAALVAAACAQPAPPPPARLSVEVLRGFAPSQVAPRSEPGHVVVLLDSTRSMERRAEAGAPFDLGARRAAARFVEALPGEAPLWLYVMGAERGNEACRPVRRLGRAPQSDRRGALLGRLASLRPASEGGLAAALDRVREDLASAGGLAGGRVVVFSDLSPDCGGDVCASAEKLVAGGALLDVVAIGPARAPACLRESSGLAPAAPPAAAARQRTRYCLELAEPDPLVLACSSVGGPPVAAPAGRARVVVELDPPLRVDAYFAPGRDHVLQVLDFPALDPPVRRWRWRDVPAKVSGE